ncbi:19937_t:CDS:2, partial [Racocetra persica]
PYKENILIYYHMLILIDSELLDPFCYSSRMTIHLPEKDVKATATATTQRVEVIKQTNSSTPENLPSRYTSYDDPRHSLLIDTSSREECEGNRNRNHPKSGSYQANKLQKKTNGFALKINKLQLPSIKRLRICGT